jgi:hypothetical protein
MLNQDVKNQTVTGDISEAIKERLVKLSGV